MTGSSKNHRLEHKIAVLRSVAKDCVPGDDGYWVYWPTSNKGCYAEHDLHVIANLLYEANRKWDNELMEFFRNNP